MSGPPATRWRRFAGPAIILLAAAIASAPQLVLGSSCGHDLGFHFNSWFDAVQAWRHGIAYPHWAASANFGAGEPRFVFYPPASWMLGAAFGLLLPWTMVAAALTFLCLAGTGLATRALARQALAEGPSTLAGCAALFSAYALYTAYARAAFGELTGGIWIPLLLLFALRDRKPDSPAWRRAFDGSAAPLALVLAGAWLSDAPLGLMASYLLAAVTLLTAVLWRSWAPLLRASVAVVAGLLLSAFYLYPAFIEQHWVAIRQAAEMPAYRIENSWLFTHHASQQLAFHDSVLKSVSRLGIYMIVLAFIGLYVAWQRGSLPGTRRWWLPLAIIPPAVLLLQLPISLPIWNTLPKLSYLQFPWRWLVTLEGPMAIFLAAAFWPGGLACLGRRLSVAAITLYFAVACVQASHTFYTYCTPQYSVSGMLRALATGKGLPGTDEYMAPRADDSLLAMNLPAACLTTNPQIPLGEKVRNIAHESFDYLWTPAQGTCDATYPAVGRPGSDRLTIRAVTPHAGYLILRRITFPAWRVRVNGQLVRHLPHRNDGLMAVPVPQGPVDLTVDWITTPDRIAARWLSLAGVLMFTLLWLVERKISRNSFIMS